MEKKKRGKPLQGKNEYVIDGNLAYVKLTNTDQVMVCDADLWEKYKAHSWSERKGYAGTSHNKRTLFFHKLVKECPDGYVIDHINRNTFDNRRENLRVTTPYVNLLNTSVYKNNKCGYKGIKKRKKGYEVQITVNKKEMYLGYYHSLDEAIIVRKQAEEKYHNPIIEKETLF